MAAFLGLFGLQRGCLYAYIVIEKDPKSGSLYACFDFVKFKYAYAYCFCGILYIYYAYDPETRCTAVYSNTIVTLCMFVVYVFLCNQHTCAIRTVSFTVLRNTYSPAN